jgi:hypothetical protein
MANLRHLRPNALRIQAQRYSALLVALGLSAVLAALLVHPLAAIPAGLPIPALLARRRRLLAGASGEERVVGNPEALPGSLAALPDGYTVFNQVRIRDGERERELDTVVVGPNAVFVIEVKNLAGEVSGTETDARWTQRRRDHNGTIAGEREFTSPVIQVKYELKALRKYLSAKGVNAWVQGIVVMANPRCRLFVRTVSTPVLTLADIVPYILRFSPAHRATGLRIAVRELERLRRENDQHRLAVTGRKVARGFEDLLRRIHPRPQHVSYFMRDFVNDRVKSIMEHDYVEARGSYEAARPQPVQPIAATPGRIRAIPAHVVAGGQIAAGKNRRRLLRLVIITPKPEDEESA